MGRASSPARRTTLLLLAAAATLAVLCGCPLGAAAQPRPAAAAAGGKVATTAAVAGGPACNSPCYVVSEYWPYKTCKAECDKTVCGRGWGVWTSNELCCTPGAGFPDGCSVRPKECWVVESYNVRTCMRDDRKCLQGSGVFSSKEVCCTPGVAFPEGCGNVAPSPQPCWVVDTYSPSRLCRSTNTLCGQGSGVQTWASQEACCAKGGAFPEGCTPPPPVPCYVVGSYWPSRTCDLSNDIAVCNRGWGVYGSKDVCCSPNVAFPEGCSPEPDSATPAAVAAATAVPAAAARQAAGTAAPRVTAQSRDKLLGKR